MNKEPIQKEDVKTATEMMVKDMQEEEYYRIKHTPSDTFIEGELMEKLADIEHQRWSDWQKWVHSKCVKASLKDGHLESKEYGEAYFIPPILYDRWERQIKTPYSELSEKEKESDREQVRRYLPLLKSSLQARERLYKNEAGEACIALEKILSGRQATDITDDEIRITSMYIENKRKQDEANYINYLLDKIEEQKEKIIHQRQSILEEIEKKIDDMGFVQPEQAGQFGLHASGYNQALEDIKEILKDNKE